MAYISPGITVPIRPGAYLLLTSTDTDPRYQQLSPLNSRFLPGSTFSIEEVWKISLTVQTNLQIDKFQNWAYPKERLGSYQIIRSDNIPDTGADSDGFISQRVSYISRTQLYTVISGANDSVQLASIDQIDQCNFQTLKISATYQGLGVEFQRPFADRGLLTVQRTYKGTKFSNFTIKRSLRGIGVFLYPGVSIESSEYSMGIVNGAVSDDPDFTYATCAISAQPPTDPDCDQAFTAYLAANPGTYRDATSADVNGLGSQLFIYTCPGGSGTRNYFRSIGF